MLKPHALGLAGAGVTGVCYVVESTLFFLMPEKMLNFYSTIMYNLDMSVMEGEPQTAQSFFVGLVSYLILSYLGLLFFGWMYNKLEK